MQYTSLAFIGGGNMAQSLIGGLIADGWPAHQMHVAEPDADKRGKLAHQYGVQTHADNDAAARAAQTVVLAVKPQVMHDVLNGLSDAIATTHPLIISIAAGIPTESIVRWLKADVAVVRVMPNTPALLQTGASGLYATKQVSDAQRDVAESIMRAVGIVTWVQDEIDIDKVTAVSGSGPAYFFLMMELMVEAALELGLPADQADILVRQTALGAAKMAMESQDSPATLRARVTSPGGTTQAALEHMRHDNIEATVKNAVRAAFERSCELGKLLGE